MAGKRQGEKERRGENTTFWHTAFVPFYERRWIIYIQVNYGMSSDILCLCMYGEGGQCREVFPRSRSRIGMYAKKAVPGAAVVNGRLLGTSS